jgi:hypothetical protein
MSDDPRCCGSGTCIIDADGHCWCGQRWNGNELVGPGSACATPTPAKSDHTADSASAEGHSAKARATGG